MKEYQTPTMQLVFFADDIITSSDEDFGSWHPDWFGNE